MGAAQAFSRTEAAAIVGATAVAPNVANSQFWRRPDSYSRSVTRVKANLPTGKSTDTSTGKSADSGRQRVLQTANFNNTKFGAGYLRRARPCWASGALRDLQRRRANSFQMSLAKTA